MIFRRLWQSSSTQNDLLSENVSSSGLTLFKLKDDELKFSNAIRVAQEVEEAAKVAKETVHGQPSTSVQKVYHAKSKTSKMQKKKTACFRCGNSGHFSKACPHIKSYLQLLQENRSSAICMHVSTKR